MVGAVLLMGGMWGYPGGPIREEMLCLESMYMFPVGEQTKGQWLTVRLVSRLSHMQSASSQHTVSLLSYAKPEKNPIECAVSLWIAYSHFHISTCHEADNIHNSLVNLYCANNGTVRREAGIQHKAFAETLLSKYLNCRCFTFLPLYFVVYF